MKTNNKIFIFIITLLLVSCSKDDTSEVIDVLFFQTIDENTVLPTTGLYDSIKHNQKQVYIFDDFSQDSGFWSEYSTSGGYFKVLRKNGLYEVLRSYEFNTGFRIIPQVINDVSSTDFEIEYKLKKFTREDDYFHPEYNAGFIWGASLASNNRGYYLIKEYYSVVDENNEDYERFIVIGQVRGANFTLWQKIKVSSFKSFKKFTIRKIHNQYYFFIDEEVVGKHEFTPFFGNKVGFRVGEYTDFYVDDFIINYLVNVEDIF